MSHLRVSRLMEYDEKHPEGAGSSMDEKLFMFSLIRILRPDRVLEIGVSRGHMTCWLALALALNKKGHLTSVDNFSRNHGGEAASPAHALKRLKDNHLARFVDMITSDSVEYMRVQPRNSFGVVWVDGDHSFQGALEDIQEAERLATQVIGVHDTNQQYSGPRDAITTLQGNVLGCWIQGSRGIWIRNP